MVKCQENLRLKSEAQVRSVSRVLEPGLKSNQFTLLQAGAQDLGVPKGSHEKSSNFKPVSKASKVIKIGPKATQKHQKWTLKTTEFQLL